MKYLLDSHTHTIASGHAYCTLLEMVRAAASRGLELLCISRSCPCHGGHHLPGLFCQPAGH